MKKSRLLLYWSCCEEWFTQLIIDEILLYVVSRWVCNLDEAWLLTVATRYVSWDLHVDLVALIRLISYLNAIISSFAYWRHRVTHDSRIDSFHRLQFEGQIWCIPLVFKHVFAARERFVALRALRLEAHPEFQALDVTKMLAVREHLQSIALLVVGEANEASHDPMVNIRVSVSHNSHLDEVSWIHALLKHIVDSVLSECLNSRLMLHNWLLNVCQAGIVEFVGHLLVMIDTAKYLERVLFNRCGLFDLRVAVEDEANEAQD